MSKRLDSGRARSRLDHESDAGGLVMFEHVIEVIAPDGSVSHSLTILCHQSGALSVAGNINDEKIAHDILDNALDAILAYHVKRPTLQVPGRDIQIAGVSVREVRIKSELTHEREYMRALIMNAKQAITDMHARRALVPDLSKRAKIEL